MISIDQETVTTLAEVLSTVRVIWHQQSRQTTAVRPYTRKPWFTRARGRLEKPG